MTSRAKPTTAPAATRASARTKTPTSAVPSTPVVAVPKRTTRAAAAKATTTVPAQPQIKSAPAKTLRKPVISRNLSRDSTQATSKTTKPVSTPQAVKQTQVAADGDDKEPIKAYLRIRPNIRSELQGQDDEAPSTAPYLSALSETTVEMTDPSPSSRLRPHSSRATYTFSRVFPPETSQPEFFASTALPLVRGFLDGESALLFAYGVTNSGKTYTIQGGAGKGDAGLLPRTLDVLFNSIDGLQSNAPFKPVRLHDVEYDPALDRSADGRSSGLSTDNNQPFDFATLNADQSMLGSLLAEEPDIGDIDETCLKVDRNYEYAIWISYAEVYNEKVFDLLGDQTPGSMTSSTSSLFSTGSFTSSSTLSSLASTTDFNNPLLIKRKALVLKNDPDGGKYIAGLRSVRVRTREEARAVVKLGQINRRVFGTLANAASSRSHSIFTISLVRIHGGSPNDKESAHVARLAVVDLAGSERTKNTQNTGERLKEAGNINKSLMVLGQCMEILRANQRRIATAGGNHAALKLAVVPFRHSKLTELFMDFFVGGARATMIVNVNPYDTGFDENSHVMKFSALAREVVTVTNIPKRIQQTRHVTVSIGGRRPTEAHLAVLEEDEEETAVEDDEPLDGLVETLFEQLQEMRVKLFEAELRAATVESDLREEIVKETGEQMQALSNLYAQRLKDLMEDNGVMLDRKIDLLWQAVVAHGAPSVKPPSKSKRVSSKTQSSSSKTQLRHKPDEGDDSENEVGDLLSQASHEESFDLGSDSDVLEDDSGVEDYPPSSPLAGKEILQEVHQKEVRVSVKHRDSGSVGGLLPTDGEEDEAEMTDEDDDETEGDSNEDEIDDRTHSDSEDDASKDEEGDEEEDEEDEDQYPTSMIDDEDDNAPSWEAGSSRRTSTVSECLEVSADYSASPSPSPSPPPTVKKANRAPSRVIKKESESEDELLLSPKKPVRSTRSSARGKNK